MDILLTLVLYTLTALSSIGLFSLANRSKKKFKRRMALVFAIAIPSLVAGLRGASVGGDTSMYIREYYSPGSWLFGTGFTRTFELGYSLLRDFIFRLGLPHQVMFFIMQGATISFLYAATREEKDQIDVKVAMFVYMFDAYFQSFNMMRQALAVAIVIYAYTQIVKDKYIRGVLFILCALLFHQTAIVCFLVVFVILILKSKHAKIYICVGATLAILLLANNTLTQRVAIILLGEKAIWYTTISNTGSHLWVYIIKITPIILLIIFVIKNANKNDRILTYCGLALVGYLIAAYGNFVATDAQRIALYISRTDAIVFGYAVNRKLMITKKSSFRQKHIKYFIYAYFIVMYLYNYFYVGVSEIVPYALY